jgi:hypothetical protein
MKLYNSIRLDIPSKTRNSVDWVLLNYDTMQFDTQSSTLRRNFQVSMKPEVAGSSEILVTTL